VIRADWDWLGQLRPNDMVRFVEVSWEEAELARRILRDRWQTWLTRLAVASDCPGIFPLPRI
jgi:allophanate hydrolase subunit 2